MNKVEQLLNHTKEKMNNPQQCKGHDFSHILRVYKLGKEIGLKENADMRILEPALILHDIISPANQRDEHALLSSEYAGKILSDFEYSQEEIDQICYAISSHSRTSNIGLAPSSLEAQILYDADKLDGMGEEGISRLEKMFANNLEKGVKWYLGRIIDFFQNEPLYTGTSKEILGERAQISIDYCKRELGEQEFNNIASKYNFSV